MRRYLTANDVANNVKMIRSSFSGVIIMTEGDTDSRLFRGFADNSCCKIISAYNKENAINAIKLIEDYNFQGVLAIIDADFDHILNTAYTSNNIFLTDFHDIEMMILKSTTLEKLLSHYGSLDKLEKFQIQQKMDIRSSLIQSCVPLGCFRFYSIKNRLCFTFEDLSYHQFVDKYTLVPELLDMIKVVKNKSQAHHYKDNDLLQEINLEVDQNHDPWEICCGHDVINILSMALCGIWGSCKKTEFSQDEVEAKLRLAYEFTEFKKTNLYADLNKWEKSNSAYQIFPREEKEIADINQEIAS